MDESKLAIKPLSEVPSSIDEHPPSLSAIKPLSEVPSSIDEHPPSLSAEKTAAAATSEVVALEPEFLAARSQVTAPLTFIGGNSGHRHLVWGLDTGKVITKIRVYSGPNMIKAYTIWLTDSHGVTFGRPERTNFAEYEFQNGERITQMTLWGNGIGTRAGWIRFRTTRNLEFSYGMHSWGIQTPYPVEVASGILVGAIFNADWDIDAHGFYFLNPIRSSELTNVKYPTLDFDSMGIVPTILDRFHFTNNASTDRNWNFTRTMTEAIHQTWSTTVDVSVHASITVTAGIPMVAEVSSQFGWQVGVTSHHETSQTSEQVFNWSVSGTAHPGDRVDLQAVTRRGSLNVPYEGWMVVTLRNGARFGYLMKGAYSGVSYSEARVVDNSTK